MAETTTDAVLLRAIELGRSPSEDAVAELVDLAGGQRAPLETARDEASRRLHGNASDWALTGALTLLNRALVRTGWTDRYDWKPRWQMPRVIRMFRRP